MDEHQELDNSDVNLARYPKDPNAKIQKYSGSLSDSGNLLVNIRGNKSKSKLKRSHEGSNVNLDYLTYNAIDFQKYKKRSQISSDSKGHYSSISSRSIPKKSGSLSSGSKKKSSVLNSKTRNLPDTNRISVTSVIPSTITSLTQQKRALNIKKNKSNRFLLFNTFRL